MSPAEQDVIGPSAPTGRPARPARPGPGGITYADRRQQFAEVPDSVSGRCLFADGPDGINAALARLPLYSAAKTVVSLVPGVGRSTFDLERVADPYELEEVDFA